VRRAIVYIDYGLDELWRGRPLPEEAAGIGKRVLRLIYLFFTIEKRRVVFARVAYAYTSTVKMEGNI
jgi:hypothetical protein